MSTFFSCLLTFVGISGMLSTVVPFGTAGRCHFRLMVGGESPPSGGELSFPPVLSGREVVKVNVVTYDELFQLMLVLISFASLIIAIMTKKK